MSEVDGVLNVSGYWTVGTVRALAIVAIPLIMVGMATGFMRRVVGIGIDVGGK
tara:strand:- start:308 stop:466 length:159 start_codon:yes stop_codon:yes gene_type:complete